MTNELIKILSDFVTAIDDYKASVIPFEAELVDMLKKLNQRLGIELEKQELPEIETKWKIRRIVH